MNRLFQTKEAAEGTKMSKATKTKFRYIADMRGRLGLKPDDSSLDAKIESMTATDRLGLITGWNLGWPDWEHIILNWARDAGFKITEPK
jgi:hypothetical protein